MIGSFIAVGSGGALGLSSPTGALGLIAGLLVPLSSRWSPAPSLNMMIERVAYRPLRNAPKLAPLITAVGFCFILQNVGLLWLGGSQLSRARPDPLAERLFTIGGVHVHNGDVLAFGVTVPLVFLLTRSSPTAGWARPCAPPPRTPRRRG